MKNQNKFTNFDNKEVKTKHKGTTQRVVSHTNYLIPQTTADHVNKQKLLCNFWCTRKPTVFAYV